MVQATNQVVDMPAIEAPRALTLKNINQHVMTKKGQVHPGLSFSGSPARTRTADPMVNSHLLCQLSYWGSVDHKKL